MAIHRRLLTFNQPTNHLTNQLNDRQGTKKTATVLWDRLFAAAEASTGTLTFPKDPELAGAPDNEAAGCDLMSQPARIANWLVAWQKTLPLDAVVTIGNYTYLDGPCDAKIMRPTARVLARSPPPSPAPPPTVSTSKSFLPSSLQANCTSSWRSARTPASTR